jgi:hypothetical protein
MIIFLGIIVAVLGFSFITLTHRIQKELSHFGFFLSNFAGALIMVSGFVVIARNLLQ